MALARFFLRSVAVSTLLFAASGVADAQQQQSLQQAGVAAAVRGRVEVAMAAGAVGREIKSGEAIYLGNAIKSAPESGMQILLLDQTTFTIGPNSEITIDQFVFDPNTSTGKVAASVAKGVFRFVTGKVAQTNPSDMTIRLPTGNIGIRGTIAVGSVEPGIGGQPPKQEIVLLGPGRGREGSNRIGALVLSTGGSSGGGVTIDQPGFGSQFGAGGTWGTPVRYTPEMINAIQARLDTPITNKGPGAPEGTGAPAGSQSAASEGTGSTFLSATGLETLPTLDKLVTDASQSSPTTPMMVAGIPNGQSTFEQLRMVNTGTFFYSSSGTPLSLGGSYDILVNIDFGNRTIGGGNSRIDVNSLLVFGSLPFQTQSFATGSGTASFTQSGIMGLGGSICPSPCSTSITVAPQNSGGVAGATVNHSVVITGNPSSSSGSGSATRQPGSAP